MKTFVRTMFVAILTVAMGLPLAIAQNSTAPVNPDVATKKDLRRATGTMSKEIKQASKAQSDRLAKQLEDMKTAEAQRAAQAALEAQQNADHDAVVREREYAGIGLFALLAFIGIIIAMRANRKVPVAAVAIPELPVSATPPQVKAYAEEKGLVGKTIPYVAQIDVPNSNDPTGKVFVTVQGEVRYAGTDHELYVFGKHQGASPRRFDAAKRAYHASQSIHAVA